jgi:hypothetical protein
MYLGIRNKQQHQLFNNNCWRIATPILGFPSGKCCTAPITFRVIGAARFFLYLGITRTEAFLMASSTSYLSVYRDASAVSYCFYALPITCKHLVVLVSDIGRGGSALLCFSL